VENPRYFENLLISLGASPIEFESKSRCCGGSLIITNRHAALDMVEKLLQDATESQAEVIATTCPMCNVNLEVYQRQVNREFGTNYSMPVVYFTQLMGIALGCEPKELGINKDVISNAIERSLARVE
jgi:heterodisulfide reductase subunit B